MAFPVDNIRSACKERGITLAELERALGIGNGVIAKWETSKRNPPYDKICKIADYLKVSVERLTGEKEKPTENGGLSAEEWQILKSFRNIPDDLRPTAGRMILSALQSLSREDDSESQ